MRDKYYSIDYLKQIVNCSIFLCYAFIGDVMGLSLDPPSGWNKANPTQAGTLLQFVSPNRENSFTPNLIVASESPRVSWEALDTDKKIAEYTIRIQERMLPQFKVENLEPGSFSDISGILATCSYAFGQLDLAAYQFIFRNGNEIATVVFTCLRKDLERFRDDFKKSLESLRPD